MDEDNGGWKGLLSGGIEGFKRTLEKIMQDVEEYKKRYELPTSTSVKKSSLPPESL